MTTPALVKANRVIGNKVVFRNATEDDAEFIVQLRTDPEKGKYLSKTSSDVSLQVAWLEKYANDPTQIYFIIEDKHGERFGTVRLYDQKEESFCWGSWIMREGRPSGFAMESALMVYLFALGLGFTRSHFDVRKGNHRARRFHERFGAKRMASADDDYIYNISADSIRKAIDAHRDILPNGIEVERD